MNLTPHFKDKKLSSEEKGFCFSEHSADDVFPLSLMMFVSHIESSVPSLNFQFFCKKTQIF